MARDDWYRRTTWTAEDEQAFRHRLARTRTASTKAQYLCVQAGSLAQTKDPELLEVALVLLDEMLANYPERIHLAQAHLQRAYCLAALDRTDEALRAFRAALAAQRDFPNVQTRAPYEFGMFCLHWGLEAFYEEAVAALDEFATDSPFPADHFEEAAIRAIAAEHRGQHEVAAEFARQALAAAAQDHTGLRHHPKLGLVGSGPAALQARLRQLAAE